MEVDLNITYEDLKYKLLETLNISPTDNKILKVRNIEGVLIPFMNILDSTSEKLVFFTIVYYI